LGTALSIAWTALFTSSFPQSAQVAVAPVYRALNAKRWSDARLYADLALDATSESTDDVHILRVNPWMACQEMGEDVGRIEGEMEAWKPPNDEPRTNWRKLRWCTWSSNVSPFSRMAVIQQIHFSMKRKLSR
jgi:hypothetical protein